SHYDIVEDRRLLRLIKDNLPIPLDDLRNSDILGVDNNDLIEELMKRNQLIVSGSYDMSIKLWDSSSGLCINTFNGHTHWVSSVAFINNNKLIVSGSCDNSIKLWDSSSGLCINTFNGHTGSVNSVAFSNDNKWIVSGSYDKSIK